LTTGVRVERYLEVSAAQARNWFLSLEQHPEQYQFDTHGGFIFLRGGFGEVGAHFQTRERFFGIPLTLVFELTAVEELGFCFRLIRPPLPIWGRFGLEPAESGATLLTLAIGGGTQLGRWLVECPGVRQAIRQQIQREVDHIARSMQSALP